MRISDWRSDVCSSDLLHLLTGALASPCLHAQIADLQQRLPKLRHHVWQPWSRDNIHDGARLAFGRPLDPVYRFADAQIIVALDADFLAREPGHVRYARDFIDGRRITADQSPRMNRLYVAEPTESLSRSEEHTSELQSPLRISYA